MTTDDTASDPSFRQKQLEAGRRSAGWTVEQLWLHYVALGGPLSVFDLEAYLAGLMPIPAEQQDVLACALNERLSDLHQSIRMPYLTALTTWPGEDALALLLDETAVRNGDQP